jgi:hypothetical protein
MLHLCGNHNNGTAVIITHSARKSKTLFSRDGIISVSAIAFSMRAFYNGEKEKRS